MSPAVPGPVADSQYSAFPFLRTAELPPKEGVGGRGVVEGERSGLGGFIELKHWNRAEETGRLSDCAAGEAGREKPVVSVIEDRQSELSCRVARRKRRPVLRVEPVGRIRSSHQGEIALVAQMPEDVSCSVCVRVVHLHQPVLVSDRNNYVSVVR